MKKSIVWVTIPAFQERYLISDYGDVMSVFVSKSGIKSTRILRPRIHNGYYRVALQLNNFRVDKSTHRLVAEAFIKNKNNLPQVNHIDGNKLNNSASNLEWCNASQNAAHAFKSHLRHPIKGEKHGRSKLTEKDVIAIRHIHEKLKITQSDVAAMFAVRKCTICDIITRKTWKHI